MFCDFLFFLFVVVVVLFFLLLLFFSVPSFSCSICSVFTPPPWVTVQRLTIAAEVAEAVAYLHAEVNMAHGRLVGEAVVLDERGAARLVPPRPGLKSRHSKAADVRCFGVLLWVLLCGADQPVNLGVLHKVERSNQPSHLKPLLDEMVRRESYWEAAVLPLARLAAACLRPKESERPAMTGPHSSTVIQTIVSARDLATALVAAGEQEAADQAKVADARVGERGGGGVERF